MALQYFMLKIMSWYLAVSWNQICENASIFFVNIALSVLWGLQDHFSLLKSIVKKLDTGMDFKILTPPNFKGIKTSPS